VALVAALTPLKSICVDDVVLSSLGALKLFQETEGLAWADTKDKAALVRRLGFCSGTHRRERFRYGDLPNQERETARGYEISRSRVQDLLARYSSVAQPSPPSHTNEDGTAGLDPSLTMKSRRRMLVADEVTHRETP